MRISCFLFCLVALGGCKIRTISGTKLQCEDLDLIWIVRGCCSLCDLILFFCWCANHCIFKGGSRGILRKGFLSLMDKGGRGCDKDCDLFWIKDWSSFGFSLAFLRDSSCHVTLDGSSPSLKGSTWDLGRGQAKIKLMKDGFWEMKSCRSDKIESWQKSWVSSPCALSPLGLPTIAQVTH